ncbi:MAG: Uma2 family endonuclease [Anaerolineae bacterium]
MIDVQSQIERRPLVLQLQPAIDMTHEQFFEFCQLNRDLRIERTAEGEIVIMAPAGGETSARNTKLTSQVDRWAEEDGSGVVFDSSGGFDLPSGATRAPDVAWVKRSRLTTLAPEEKQRFLPLCPDFVIELRSPSDSLSTVQDKMEEYLANGAKLGWLIDPAGRRVYVYRPGADVERLDNPTELAGDPVLTGFVLDLTPIWEPAF